MSELNHLNDKFYPLLISEKSCFCNEIEFPIFGIVIWLENLSIDCYKDWLISHAHTQKFEIYVSVAVFDYWHRQTFTNEWIWFDAFSNRRHENCLLITSVYWLLENRQTFNECELNIKHSTSAIYFECDSHIYIPKCNC